MAPNYIDSDLKNWLKYFLNDDEDKPNLNKLL